MGNMMKKFMCTLIMILGILCSGGIVAYADTPVIITEGAVTNVTLNEEAMVTVSLQAIYTTPESLTWTTTSSGFGTASITFSGINAEITYAPGTDYNGTDSFEVGVSDGSGGTDSIIIHVTIDAVNDAPINTSIPGITGSTSLLAILTAIDGEWNDSKDTNVSGATGTSIIYGYQWQRADDNSGSNLESITGVTSGTYTITKADQSKYIRVKITATDDGIGSPSSASEVAFSGWIQIDANRAPEITDGDPRFITMSEDGNPTPFALTLTATDLDLDTLTWSVTSQGGLGTATVTSTGAVSYTPNLNANGTDSFVVTVSDGSGGTDSITINVTISAVNDAPTITQGSSTSLSGNEDSSGMTINLEATDVDGSSFTWDITSGAAFGTTTVSGLGEVTYSPNPNYNGNDGFVVTVSDGNGGFDSITINVTVAPVNDSPVNTSVPTVSGTHHKGQSLTADPGAWNDDLDGNMGGLTYSYQWERATDTSGSGIVLISGATTSSYTLVLADNGKYVRVKVTCNDGGTPGSSSAFLYTEWVLVANQAPAITNGESTTVTMSEDGNPTPFALTLAATDSDAGDTLTWSISSGASIGVAQVTSQGAVSYVPNTNYNGNDSFVVMVFDGNGGTDSITINVTITAVNDVPVFIKGADQSISEDAGSQTIHNWATGISSGPADESGQTLTFIVTGNTNPELFATPPAIAVDGALNYSPALHAYGSATITLTLSDDGGATTTSQSFNITIAAVNDAPTMEAVADFAMDEDTSATKTFEINDVDHSITNAELSFETSDTALLPKANITFAVTGTQGSITVTPVADRSGTVTVTLTVRDAAGAVATQAFTITVNPINDAPTIGTIADRTIDEDNSTGIIGIALGDSDNNTATLGISAISGNGALISEVGITLGGSGASRTISLTPSKDQTGSSLITITVSDGALTATTSFTVTVVSVNDAPTISPITDITIDEETTTQVAFTIGDIDTTSSALTVSASVVNTAMIPRTNLVLSGTGADRILTITPLANKFGSSLITISVKDEGGLIVSRTFNLTVTSVNDLPTMSVIGAQITNEDTVKTINVTVGDIEDPAGSLILTGSSSDTTLVPNGNITFGGTGAARTISINPAANLSGTTEITITLKDSNNATVSGIFTLTVSAVNDVPTFTMGSNITVQEDASAQTLPNWATAISAGPTDETGQPLSFDVTNDNSGLFTSQPTVTSGGSLSFTSAANANGTAVVSLRLTDGAIYSNYQSFNIIIQSINDAPVASPMSFTLSDEEKSFKGVLQASDIEKDPLVYVIATNGTNGTAVISNTATGAFEYTPNVNYYGADSFSFTVFDGDLTSGEVTVSADILGINDPPVASSQAITTNEDAQITGNLLGSDIDSPNLTFSILADANNGTVSLNSSGGAFSYTPDPNYFGTDRFTYRVFDGALFSNIANISITVSPVNDKPVATSETIHLDRGQQLSGILKANDLEQDNLSYILVSNPSPGALLLTNSSTGAFAFTPGGEYVGTYSFSFKANDGASDSDTETVTITVQDINIAPIIVVNVISLDYSTSEDTALSSNVTATDANTHDVLTYSIVSQTRNGTITSFNASDGAFTYTPNANFNGIDRFTTKATDSKLYTSIIIANISVAAINDQPVVYDQIWETTSNTAITGNMVGYDADGGDILTFSSTGSAVNGTVENNNGSFTFTPSPGFTGTGSFNFIASDGTVESNLGTIIVQVYGSGGGGSGSGLGSIANITIPEDTTTTVAIAVSGYSGTTMMAVASNQSLITADGIVITTSDGGINWTIQLTPIMHKIGSTVITVTANSTSPSASDSLSFILNVTKVNHPPVAENKTLDMDQFTVLNEFVVGSDDNGDSLTYGLVTSTSNGSLTFGADGVFRYIPTGNYSGQDVFTYKAVDSGGLESTQGTVTINIRQVDQPPIATSGAIITDEDTTATGTLLGADFFGGPVTFEIVNQARLGTAEITNSTTGAFTYTPNENLFGPDAFTFKVRAGTGLYSSVVTMSVTVNPVNDTPIAIYKPFSTYEDQTLYGFIQGSDIEKSPLTYSIVETTSKGSIQMTEPGTGAFEYIPDANEYGTDQFSFTVKDGELTSAPVTINITVGAINDTPNASDAAISVNEDSTTSGSILSYISDVDLGDTQTISLIQQAGKGTVSVTTEGAYTYTPFANANGIDYFSYRTQDAVGASSNIALVTVNILPINDTPTITAAALTFGLNEDSVNNQFNFTIGDVEDQATSLSVTAVSLNGELITGSGITLEGSGVNRWIRLTPIKHTSGAAIITITVTDSGNDGTLLNGIRLNASLNVGITISPINDSPTINGKETDQLLTPSSITIDEDTSTGAISFTVNDEESGGSLTIAGSSNNTSLVASGGIVFGGSGTDRTISVTPVADQNGTAKITISVSDGTNTRKAYLTVNVTPVNDAPVVSPPAEQTINEDGTTEVLYYTISDIDSNVEAISMTAISLDESKLSTGGIVLAGNGAERTIKLTPLANASGDVTIQLMANDQSLVNATGVGTFVLHITPVNDAPSITVIADQTIDEDTVSGEIGVAVSDIDTTASGLTISVISGNTKLVNSSGITFGAVTSGGDSWLKLTPIANEHGSSLITVTVSDGTKSASKSFTLTVNPINDAPTIGSILDQTILEDGKTGIITFTVGDIDNDVTSLSVENASSDGEVITLGGITLVGNGAERTVQVTPLANQNGALQVTLTVSDGNLTASSIFTVNITPVNDPPSFTSGPAQTVNEDCGPQTTVWATNINNGFTNESDPGRQFVVSNDNNGLFSSQPTISSAGALSYTPAADVHGTALITVYLRDGQGTANGGNDVSETVTFGITVNSVNDVPSFTKGNDITVNEDCGAQTTGWAINLSKGAFNETGQTLTFAVTDNSDASLFASMPAISSTGVLTFKPAANANGTATIGVRISDDGGTANGGVSTSAIQSFTITVTPVNDAPTFNLGTTQTVLEDSGNQSVVGFATGINRGGGSYENGQTLLFATTNNNNALFSVQPGIDPITGNLTYTPAPDMNGSATVTVTLTDSGTGLNASTKTFIINVTAVNDVPAFTKGSDQTVPEDSGSQTVAGWATGLSKGPTNESSQTLAFTVNNTNNGLFSLQPGITSQGALSYTVSSNAVGAATVTVVLKDNGGTTGGGVDTSAAQTFVITVDPVNDAPTIGPISGKTINEDTSTGAITITVGDLDSIVSGLTITAVSSNATLITSGGISTGNGAGAGDRWINLIPAPDANGTSQITVTVSDGTLTSNALFTLTVGAINDGPSFTKGLDITVGTGTGEKNYSGWAKDLLAGPVDERGQTMSFIVSNNNNSLFSVQPFITSDGALKFTASNTITGTAIVNVSIQDDGGTSGGGIDTSSTKQFSITVVSGKELIVNGTIKDSNTKDVIAGATIRMLDLSGKVVKTTTSGTDGTYEFKDVTESRYILEVIKSPYSDNSRMTEVTFARVKPGTVSVTEDFLMAEFTLVLSADPSSILGDGLSKSLLTASVKDKAGNPLSGVSLNFQAEAGTFIGTTEGAITNANGTATIYYQSDALSGLDSLNIPVIVSVNDEINELYGSDCIYVTFAPGFVEGVVTVPDVSNVNKPVEGAKIKVYKDFDGDGITDFSFEQITGADGKYRIAIPKGGVNYDILITKPVTIGNETKEITFHQEAEISAIVGDGTDQFSSQQATSGLVVFVNPDGTGTIIKNCSDAGIVFELERGNASTDISSSVDPETGVFNTSGTGIFTYIVKYKMGDGIEITAGKIDVEVTENGEINISNVLIDPYGTVTEKGTATVVKDVNVKLYYADTERNTTSERIKDTLVTLPAIVGFEPSDNANPQLTDVLGKYAFMVFPQTDYYITGEKAGYITYKSPTISVYEEIVKHDFEMEKAPSAGGGMGGVVLPPEIEGKDLGIAIKAGKMKVEENEALTLTIQYGNKTSDEVKDITITGTVPAGMQMVDSGGGLVSGNSVTWKIASLPGKAIKNLTFVVQAGNMDKSETLKEVTVKITSSEELIVLEDDQSKIQVMVYSNRFQGVHERYFKGYPEGNFLPENRITRGETAAIFARLLKLDVQAAGASFKDVMPEHWAIGYIEAAAKRGIIKGYEDGTFAPDSPITRAEFATMVARYFEIERSSSIAPLETQFNDTKASWASSTIQEIYRYNIVTGYEDGSFMPDSRISRAETATMINRMLYRGPVGNARMNFPDVRIQDWFLGQVEEASKTHEYVVNPDGTEHVIQWIDDELR